MLNEIIGDVWNFADKDTIVCILTNNTVLKNGCNVMGAGIALEAKNRVKDLEKICGKAIVDNELFLVKDPVSGAWLIRFPTKYKVDDRTADIDLIRESLEALTAIAKTYPNKKILLPRPGCGCGGLSWEGHYWSSVKNTCENHLYNCKNVFIVSK